LGKQHQTSERKTWAVIWLCGVMMIAEIVGGLFFGSIALVADGLHMSTHAGALLLAALAYTYARRYANDARFTFGTGKLAINRAIIARMIALREAGEIAQLSGSEGEAGVVGVATRIGIGQRGEQQGAGVGAHVQAVGDQRNRSEKQAADNLRDHHHATEQITAQVLRSLVWCCLPKKTWS